jgi:hypothetical protein
MFRSPTDARPTVARVRAAESVELVQGSCWWCGAPADSREHKLKRSDLVREYGTPPYGGMRTLARVSARGRAEFHGATVRS